MYTFKRTAINENVPFKQKTMAIKFGGFKALIYIHDKDNTKHHCLTLTFDIHEKHYSRERVGCSFEFHHIERERC